MENSLGSVLNFECGGLALTSNGSAAANSGDAVDLLKVSGASRRREKLQPRHGALTLLALGRHGGRGNGRVLCAPCVTNLDSIGRELEERDAGGGEDVVSRDGKAAGAESLLLVTVGEVELHRDRGQLLEEVGVHGSHAARVEESGFGASGNGHSCCVAGVACVVLGATADGDVL